MILEWKCPRYWNINLDKLREEGKSTVIVDGGQIVGKIISMEERNGELYAKVEIPDKSEKELNDRLYPKFSISNGKVFDFDTEKLLKFSINSRGCTNDK